MQLRQVNSYPTACAHFAEAPLPAAGRGRRAFQTSLLIRFAKSAKTRYNAERP